MQGEGPPHALRSSQRNKPTRPAGPRPTDPGASPGRSRQRPALGSPRGKGAFLPAGNPPDQRGLVGLSDRASAPPLRGPVLREPGALQRERRGPTAGPAPTPMTVPQRGCRALTAEEGAEDEAFLLVPLEETPQGPQHPARPARPPLASPCRRKGRG